MKEDEDIIDVNDSWFDDFWYNDNEEQKEEWTIESFLKSIDLSNITPQTLSLHIKWLTEEQKQQVLNDERIKNYFQKSFLEGERTYDFYEGVFKHLSFIEMKDVFDQEFTQKYFSKKTYKEYIFFAQMFLSTKDRNKLISAIVEKDYLFDEFKKQFNNFYSCVRNMDAEHMKMLISKIEQTNSYHYFELLSIEEENAEIIIKEDYQPSTLFWLINKMSKKVVQEFYLNDSRAELMMPYLNQASILNYTDYGVVFGDKILKNPKFFEILKCNSLVDFRNILNNIEDYCTDPFYIEEKREKYYDELINSYQPKSGLFKIYEDILNDEEFFFKDIKYDPFLVERSMSRRSNRTQEKLLKETSIKLSELIIDAIFQDTIYNVWINIKEMLRYNSYLDESEKILSKEKVEFYKLIIDIDKIPSQEKISLYHKLKDKKLNIIFYEDLRRAKDLAYTKIKEKLIAPTEHPDYENKEETKKNGVTTYDLRDKEFYMLVRKIGSFYQETGATRSSGSYSFISNYNTDVFAEGNGILYGYNSFNKEKVEHMFEGDSYTASFTATDNKNKNSTHYANRISTIEELTNSYGYSEILLKNTKIEERVYKEMKPDFVVAINQVDDLSIKASKELNIPIVIITKNNNPNIDRLPNEYSDQYSVGVTNEELRKKQR